MAKPAPFNFSVTPPTIGDANFAADAAIVWGELPQAMDYITAMGNWAQTDFAKALANGTAALPSMAFASDLNLGFYRIGPDHIGGSTGGVRRWSLSSTAMQVDVPITGTAVVANSTDTTSGRVPTVGWMGLGSNTAPDVTNLNTLNMAGFFKVPGGSTGAPDSGAWMLLHENYDGTSRAQTAWRAGGSNLVVKARRSSGAGWTRWSEMYTQDSILGTVSQSGGLPTGAIIEAGANANGRFTRFADGTQECSHIMKVDYFSPTRLNATWTFPSSALGGTRPSVVATVSERGPTNVSEGVAPAANQNVHLRSGDNSVQTIAVEGSGFVSGNFMWVSLTANSRWF